MQSDTPAEDPPLDDAESDLVDETPAEQTARQLGVLRELSEVGLELLRAMARQAMAQGQMQDVAERAGVAQVVGGSVTVEFRGDMAKAYDRISRAIRLNILLEQRVTEEAMTRPARVLAAAKAAEEGRQDAEQRRRQAQRAAETEAWTDADTVMEVVEETLMAEQADLKAIGPQMEELFERLNERDCDYDCSSRPIGAVIALICKDLGVEPDWERWEWENWAMEEARTRAPGSPYADWNDPPGEGDDEDDEPALEGAVPEGGSSP